MWQRFVLFIVFAIVAASSENIWGQRIQMPTRLAQNDATQTYAYPTYTAQQPGLPSNYPGSYPPNGSTGQPTLPPATGYPPAGTAYPPPGTAYPPATAYPGATGGSQPLTRPVPPFVQGGNPYANPGAAPSSAPVYGNPAPSPYGAAPSPYGSQPAPYSIPAPGSQPYGAQPYGAPGPYDQPYGTAPSPYGAAPSPYGGGTAPYYSPTGPDYVFPNGLPQYNYSGEWTRLIQRIRFSDAWLAGGDNMTDVGVNDMEASVTLDVPLFQLPDHFFFTPGFGLHLWDGPQQVVPTDPELPAQTYDAYLDTGWNPKFNNWFAAELGVRVGVYTTFDHFGTDSIRIMGRGLGVVNVSQGLQFKLGVFYIDRNDIKLLPAFGLIWDPSPDRHWEIFFPRPKLAQRLSTVGNHNIWAYVAGEYGGGAWTANLDTADAFDYNDFRVQVGIEWIPEAQTGMSGFVEVGYNFKRELVYVGAISRTVDVPDTFMIRAGIAF